MTDFKEHILISALTKISEMDPAASTRYFICICEEDDEPCIGCVARAALKAYAQEAACTTQK